MKKKEMLPQAIEAEMSILSLLLNFPALRAQAFREIADEAFYSPANRIIYQTIRQLKAMAALTTVVQALAEQEKLDNVGGIGYLAKLQVYCQTQVVFANLRDAMLDADRRRRVIAAGLAAVASAYDQSVDCTQDVTNALSAISEALRGKHRPTLRDTFLEIADEIEEILSGGRPAGIPTRWSKLNDVTGGIRQGAYIVIGGPRGSGKSILGQNIAEDVVAAGKRALWFSYEMPAADVAKRMIASVANVPGAALFQTTPQTPAVQIQAIQRTMIQILQDNLIQIIAAPLTLSEIRLEVIDAASQGDLGVVVIDYIQLIPTEDSKNREQQVATISRGLRAISLETGVPVVALCQLNKDGQARESMSIEQDASDFWKIAFEDEDEQREGRGQICIEKNRNGQAFTSFDVQHELGFFRFVQANFHHSA